MNSLVGIGIKGSAKVDVIDSRGRVVRSYGRFGNLLLDQGMERIAEMPIANLFLHCAKGTGTTDTKEVVVGTYTQALNTVTRATGARNFVVGDVGKTIAFSGGKQAKISGFVGITQVTVGTSQTIAVAETINIYATDQTDLDAEVDRTGIYSTASGDNSTTTVSATRTLKRTFIFDPESGAPVVVSGSYSKTAGVITRDSGSTDFVAGDVGKTIKFDDDEAEYVITSYIGVTQVGVADVVTAHVSQTITMYGYNTYGEIGFSHLPSGVGSTNIRVKLATGVVVADPTSIYPGQQLRVEYTMDVTVSPSVATVSAAAPITDPSNLMSSNKNGQAVIESVDLSEINADGTTKFTAAALEPYVDGHLGISPTPTALSPLNGPDRSVNAAFVPMQKVAYVPNSHEIVCYGVFTVNAAIGSNWRSVGAYSTQAGAPAFVFLFDGTQLKSATMGITIRFKKTWSRILA